MNIIAKAVFFDTNSYRYLVTGKSSLDAIAAVEEIKKLEAAKNIAGYGIMIVGMEMLANLSEGPSGFNYADCLNGIIAMGKHCYDDHLKMVRVTPQPYLHLCKAYFNQVPIEMENRAKNMSGVINDFQVDLPATLAFHTAKSTFDQIKAYVDQEELMFSTDIAQMIEGAKQAIIDKHPKIAKRDLREKLLKFINDGAYEPFLALATITAVAITLGVQLSDQEITERAFHLNIHLPLSVGFYRWISNKIVQDNIDMQSKASKEKRWNWLWDAQVCFMISEHTIDERETILVTADTDIRHILSDFGYNIKVYTLPEYVAYLNS